MSRMLLPLLILALVAGCIEVDISVPGFPQMATYFDVSESVIQLTIAYNFLGFCLAALVYGPLSDRFGRRKVMLVGNGLLLMGATGCVIAPTIEWLLIVRFIQGMGASASAVVVTAIVADVYRGPKMVQALTAMNAALTVLMALAPVVGGFVNIAVGWWGNYAIVAFICALSWLMLLFFLPETTQSRPATNGKAVVREYKMLLKSGRFMAHATMPSLLYAGYITFVSSAPFLYIDRFGLSILSYALHQGVIVGSFTVMNFFASRLIQRMGKGGSIIGGLSLCCGSIITLVSLSFANACSPVVITGLMMIYSSGFSLGYPAVFAESLDVFPALKGAAASVIMSLRTFLCAGFVGLGSFFYNSDPLPVFLVLLGCMGVTALNGLIILRGKGCLQE